MLELQVKWGMMSTVLGKVKSSDAGASPQAVRKCFLSHMLQGVGSKRSGSACGRGRESWTGTQMNSVDSHCQVASAASFQWHFKKVSV